jgi:hypothetical protein
MAVKLYKFQASVVDDLWFVSCLKHVTPENFNLHLREHFIYMLKIWDLLHLVSSVNNVAKRNVCAFTRTQLSLIYPEDSHFADCTIGAKKLSGWWCSVLDHAMAEAVTRLSPWRPIFKLSPVPVSFLVDRVALGQLFLWVHWLSPDNIIPQMLYAHSFIH